jgi:hypothetical protein
MESGEEKEIMLAKNYRQTVALLSLIFHSKQIIILTGN